MNTQHYCEAAAALAKTIDGISKQVSTIALGAAALASSPSYRKPSPDAGYKNEENILSPAITTPQSELQSETAYLSRELKSGTASIKFPVLKKTPARRRNARKWKLKPQSSLTVAAAPSAPWFRQASESSPEATNTFQLTSPPQLTLRRKHNRIQPLRPPNLREAEFPLQTGEDFIPALKPRPTVLFQTPHKRRRISTEENV